MKKILMLCAVSMATIGAQAEYTDDCITFSSAASFTLKTYNSAKNWNGTLWTSTDKTTWNVWNGASVNAAQTDGTGAYNLYVRGNENNTVITGDVLDGQWVLTGNDIACMGNIETLRGATGDQPSPRNMATLCYYYIFAGCTALTSAPALPATTLASCCYGCMFAGCTALTSAPALPATTLVSYCYDCMFAGCTALTSAPALPAMTLADSCYHNMFRGCTSLTSAPALPATTLASACYGSMFYGCASLTSAPALPAMMLANHCYMYMFYGCTALTDAPALPATTLAIYCYYCMFSGCTALEVNAVAPGKEWKISATTGATDWGKEMFKDTKGTLQGQPELNTTYYIKSAPVIDDCITFSSAASFTLRTFWGKTWNGTLWTSTDKINWIEWKGGEVSAAQTGGTYCLYVRGDAINTKIAGDCDYRWVLTGSNIACRGNIETLRGATGDEPSPTPMAQSCYEGIFSGCTTLTSAPALPATMLAKDCYWHMFSGCTALTNAPELPATDLAEHCYGGMFSGCTALTVAPALPATTLADWCYSGMFGGCTSLTNAPELPAMTLADYCYDVMFAGCTSLTSAPALPATTLAEGCYRSMFANCTVLTSAPELPAPKLSNYCYVCMFRGCTALEDALALPATTLAESCYAYMFAGCTALPSAPALQATTLAYACYERMFYGCTALTSAPELPATKLLEYCYRYMFYGCTSLEVNTAAPGKEWKIPATSTTASWWGEDMFTDTAGTLQGQPALNTTYYIKSAPMPPGSESNPWKIGAGKGDTVNAWTNGTTLVVQGAGKMMDFDAEDSVVPWPVEQIAAVNISSNVTAIGQNAWLGLADSVIYNGLSAGATKTMANGFGGTTQYARTAFREFLMDGASINATVALETAKSLTNEWVEVELKTSEVSVENGRIVIQHESAPQSQGFYLLQPTE